MKSAILFGLCVTPLVFFSSAGRAVNLCDFTDQTIQPILVSLPLLPDAKKWEMVWHDEFNYNGRPDPAKWTYEIGGSGWGNDEDQYYTDRIENAHVENGHLVIEARKEKYENREYTSSRLNSLQTWTYGRYEVRARIPQGRGTWSAAWMMSAKQNYGEKYWPDNGEMDFLEEVGHEPNQIHASTHTKAHNFKTFTQKTAIRDIPTAETEYHTYAIEWFPDHIDFFIDDQKIMTDAEGEASSTDWTKWPFNKDFKIILNLAVGGFWARENGIDDSKFPAELDVAYVRVYRPARPEMCAPHP